MAFCTSCGAQMEGQFCVQCGARADATAPPSTAAPTSSPAAFAATPVAAPPPAAKSKLMLWLLLGCGGLLVLGLIAMLGFGLFVSKKASEFGKNPGFAAAKMLASMNPDVEVVKADEDTGKITLRDKKTGKTVTMDFQEIQKGRFSFEGENGEKVDIQGEGAGGQGSMTFKTDKGTTRIGAGSMNEVPTWVPRYPGGEMVAGYAAKSEGEEGGTYQLKCGDSVQRVADYYEQQLKNGGMKVDRSTLQTGGKTIITLSGTNEGNGHNVSANISEDGGSTAAIIVYTAR